MLVKIFRKSLLVLLAVVMLSSVADAAASKNSGALTGNKKDAADESLERELDGGIKIECKGVKRSSNSSRIYVEYVVTAEDDTELKIGFRTIYDNKGNEFNNNGYIWIGNQDTGNTNFARVIIGGIPTEVGISYNVHSSYKATETYPRVSLTVNGKELTFRNVPGEK